MHKSRCGPALRTALGLRGLRLREQDTAGFVRVGDAGGAECGERADEMSAMHA